MSFVGIITAILPTLLQIAGFFIKKSNISDNVKKNFFEWIAITGSDIGSVKLKEYGDSAVKWFDENSFIESK